MDFMKVLDQTVREIKREVNIKVLKVPEIEQKVLDATSDEPWGPHGSDLTEIAQGTRKITECQMIMNVLWSRLNERGRNWRCAYKALAVIEYLVANGSERAVDDIIEHTFKISSLSSFEYLEPNGKDMGINVRKKVETIVGLLNDKNKIQEVRNKAAANRDKYVGLSSNGITYKSSAASFGSSNFQNSDRYGGFGGKNDGGMFKDSYKEKDRFGGEDLDNDSHKSRRGVSSESERNKSSKGSARYGSRDRDALTSSSKSNHSDDKFASVPHQSSTTPNDTEDDFDDFDPRGTSSTGLAAPSVVNQVDLFGDLMDAPLSVPPEPSSANGNANPEVDLFADADFVSASPHIEAGSNSQIQADDDLFASQPTLPSASTIDFFAAPDPVPQAETKSSKSEPLDSTAFDPFAAVPLNNFDESESTDHFGDFTSHTDQVSSEVSQNSPTDSSLNSLNQNPSVEAKGPKKDTFKVKSGIWADSLSRGIIDLNITTPAAAKKTTNLADVGIVGGLGDGSDEKGPPTSFYMGRAMGMGMGMGMGSGYGQSGFTSTGTTGSGDDDFFSSLSREQQYGSFQKCSTFFRAPNSGGFSGESPL